MHGAEIKHLRKTQQHGINAAPHHHHLNRKVHASTLCLKSSHLIGPFVVRVLILLCAVQDQVMLLLPLQYPSQVLRSLVLPPVKLPAKTPVKVHDCVVVYFSNYYLLYIVLQFSESEICSAQMDMH